MKSATSKILLLVIALLILPGIVSAATLSRNVPSQVSPGGTFTVTYASSGAPASKWFVAWEDNVTGGCTPASYRNFMVSDSGGDSSISKTFTAPMSGSCVFNGYYQFTTDSAQKDTGTATITVSGNVPPATTNNSTMMWIAIGIGALVVIVILLKKKK